MIKNIQIPKKDSGTIRVSEISIAQLSRGIYRGNAAAFKELISNAWDVDASEVRINTNFPEFDFISCVDNGPGMRLEDFISYFSEKGIGYSFKRRGKDTTDKFQRPIIGRLGIGMLAIGQLCHSFNIESHYTDLDGGKKAFRGEINLLDFDIPKLETQISKKTETREELEVGKWSYERINYDEMKKGFHVYSSDVRETFVSEMKSGIDTTKFQSFSFDLKRLHEDFYSKIERSIREQGSYLEMVWELCLLSPLPYYNADQPIEMKLTNKSSNQDSVKNNTGKTESEYNRAIALITRTQTAFEKYDFRVIFDGINLFRYMQLANDEKANQRLFYIDFEDVVAEELLKFSGYLYAQTKAIRPVELNGIQIRLRNVGIGGYDSTFLNYSKQILTIRCKWVSGEIFVSRGLERALNIDRDSFNEHDEHYKKIQGLLHQKLDVVFNEMKLLAEKNRNKVRTEKERQLQKVFLDCIKEKVKGKLSVQEIDLGPEEQLLSYSIPRKRVTLNIGAKPKRRKTDELQELVTLAYQVSKLISQNNDDEFNNFIDLISKVA